MIRTFRRFRPFLGRHRGRLLAGNFFALLEIAFSLAEPWPLAFLIDHVVKGEGTGSLLGIVSSTSSPTRAIAGALAVLAVAVIGASVCGYISTRLLNTAGQRIGYDIRRATFDHLLRLDLGFHQRHATGDLTTRITKDIDRVQDMMVDALAVLIPNALLIGGMATVMIATDSIFAAVALGLTPILAWSIHRSTTSMKGASKAARAADGEVASVVSETLSAMPVVQALELQSDRLARFDRSAGAGFEANLRAIRHQARLAPTVDLSSALARGVVIAIGVQRVLSGALSVGVLLVFLSYLSRLYSPIKALSKLTFNVSRAEASGERVHALVSTRPAVEDAVGAAPIPRCHGRLEFRSVTFSYGREPVLDGVDLTIEAGQRVAVVGPTGSGKSTLAALLLRFYDPQHGAVMLDGHDLRSLALGSIRSNIAMVLQESVLFTGTIRENIAWARPGATAADVERVAEQARVTEFSSRLPHGLDTPLGERGADLSGGQRQRIAIARAMLRDCPVLILDEPTSALDAESEALVIEALEVLMQGRTTLIIAHRLSTVRRADRIVVLDRGQIVESGAHDELMARGGLYAHLTELQTGTSGGHDRIERDAGDLGRFAWTADGSAIADLGEIREVVGLEIGLATECIDGAVAAVQIWGRCSPTEQWSRLPAIITNSPASFGQLHLTLDGPSVRYVRVTSPLHALGSAPAERVPLTGVSVLCAPANWCGPSVSVGAGPRIA